MATERTFKDMLKERKLPIRSLSDLRKRFEQILREEGLDEEEKEEAKKRGRKAFAKGIKRAFRGED